MQGGCTCGAVRYRLADRPMFTNCCHCTWCQRETGSAFALNAIIETDLLTVDGAVERVMLPSASGKGQEVVRCQTCKVALYSHYAGAGRLAAFVRVGTMDRPADCPPEVHIYTATKLPWLVLDDRVPAFEGYYSLKELWPAAAQQRREAMKARAALVADRPAPLG